ncbi:hypothetical protein QMK38_16600 [Lysinibacillus fusiformis]|nr:hypothetical protein [Lysinibacillus fusiformis]
MSHSKTSKLGLVIFLTFYFALFLYTFYLFFANKEAGGFLFIILMISSAVFFGSLRFAKLKQIV